ncbi:DUF5990 family protein [Actinoplanes couchii]|uniref:Monooxygenase n=1 Tax=Actinoplanes couchii TaxID=403638 RepID=A0ABQ3X1L1_9ACTN|nr:DUF5990 family protein [Actinoplanes couchii]MDR6316793.1 hypothetical protein [Actinoplanes couchii]GID52400.1 hypothetical protein Aco03nite_008040 [Actinoplanes couchii]
MRIRIEGGDLPRGEQWRLGDVEVGVQRRKEVVDRIPVHADRAVWEFEVDSREVDGWIDVGGPWVHGRPGARFLYLSWGSTGTGEFAGFRRAKLMFGDIPGDVLRAAAADAGTLVGRLGLTGPDGGPRCARVKPPDITWTLE